MNACIVRETRRGVGYSWIPGLLALTLSGCIESGGSGGDNRDAGEGGHTGSVTLHGLYAGTLDHTAGSEELFFIAYDERAVAYTSGSGTAYHGSYELDDDEMTAELVVYNNEGSRIGVVAHEASVTDDGHINGSFEPLEGSPPAGEVQLTLDTEAGEPIDLHELAGTYRDEAAAGFEIVVDVDGGLQGGNSLGCSFDGALHAPEQRPGLLEVELAPQANQCPAPGEYQGLGAVAGEHLLLVTAQDDETGMAHYLPVDGGGSEPPPEPEDMPDWLVDVPERGWAKVNTNTKDDAIQALDACGRTASDNAIRRVWEAFAGSAWDPNRKVAWIFGGGHAVTTFNAPIAIDVFDREWRILHYQTASIDSDFEDESSSGRYVTADYVHGYQGAPVSAHSYDNNKYLPVADRFITFGGAQAGDGSWWRKFLDASGNQIGEWFTDAERTGPYVYDYSRRDAGKVGGNTGTAVEPTGCDNSDIQGAQAWTNLDFMSDLPSWWSSPDRSTVCRIEDGNDVCYHSRASLQRIEFDDLSASLQNAGDYWQGHIAEHSAVIAPVGDKEIFLQVRLRPEPYKYDLHDLKWWEIQDFPETYRSEALKTGIDFSGSSYGTDGPHPDEGNTPGVAYDSERDKIIVWRGGRHLYELVPPQPLSTDGWSVVDFENNPVTDDAPDASGWPDSTGIPHRGVIGHFHYDAEWDLFFAVEGVHGDLWVYKPESWNPD